MLIASPEGAANTSVPVDVDGIEWEIVSIDARPVGDGFGAWFQISSEPPTDAPVSTRPEDGNVFVTGNDGCNTYSGRAELMQGELSVSGGVVSTAMACPPPFAGLRGKSRLLVSDGWLIVEGRTTLLAFDRSSDPPDAAQPVISETVPSPPLEPLSTVAVGTDQPLPDGFQALEGSRWVLSAVDGQAWTSSLTPSFTIGEGVTFSGHDGCHRYTGNWWLDADVLSVRSEVIEPLPCRAAVAPDLRPAAGFRFEFDGELIRSGPMGPGVDAVGAPSTEFTASSELAEPFVTFERLAAGTEVTESAALVGTWRTVDGVDVEFTPSQVIVGDCGAVAEWVLTERLTITRLNGSFSQCAVAAESTSFAMLLLDSRSPERLEILDDGTLAHTSDTALTLLFPA